MLLASQRGTLNDRGVNGDILVFAMCALDALGIPLMMGPGTVLVSQDRPGSEPVHETSMAGIRQLNALFRSAA